MAVALYLRVSTEEQRERQSIATQLDFALRYCALHQLTIHQTYADDGVSGTVPVELRPLGARLLEDARQHQFNQLLVFKLDRLDATPGSFSTPSPNWRRKACASAA